VGTLRFVIGTLAVLAFLLAWAMAQGLGQAVGHGLSEMLTR